jgi:predicted Zn-dependent protease
MKWHLVFVLGIAAFATVAQDVSVDKKLGEEGKAEVEASMGIYDDPEKTKILTEIGNRLAGNLKEPPFKYQFFIVDMGEPNAFALPGGYVFFTRGILALTNSEDELAGVMGHEIIHSNNRHAIKQRKKGILPGLLQLPGALAGAVGAQRAEKLLSPLSKSGEAIIASHSRKDEYEADEEGIILSAKSGYDPKALASMLSTLTTSVEAVTGQKEKGGYFNDHPLTPDRVKRINKGALELQAAQVPKLFKDRREFLKFIDGILVGPNPNQGVFNGDWFLHPDMDFKLNIPAKWLRQNTRDAVAAMDSSESAAMMLELEPKAKSSAEAARTFAENYKKKTNRNIDIESRKLNGNNAHRVGFVNTAKDKQVFVTVMWVEYKQLVFRLTGAASEAHKKEINNALETFDSLTKEDRDSITKRILKVVEAKKGESIEELSKRTQNVIAAKLTASANEIPEDIRFSEGDLVKIVIEVPYK